VPTDGNGVDQLILDESQIAANSSYLALGTITVSPDDSLLAYSVDFTGNQLFVLRFRNMTSNTDLEDEITNVFYTVEWGAGGPQWNSTTYCVSNSKSTRSYWRYNGNSVADASSVCYRVTIVSPIRSQYFGRSH
jgi:protease II